MQKTLCAGAAPVSALLSHANLNATAGSQGNGDVPDATHSMLTPVPDHVLAPGPSVALYRDPAKSAKATSRLPPFEQTFKQTRRSQAQSAQSEYAAQATMVLPPSTQAHTRASPFLLWMTASRTPELVST